jgi:ABC-type sugar transport system ATPase subunit
VKDRSRTISPQSHHNIPAAEAIFVDVSHPKMERASSAEYIRAELQARQLSENSMRSASLDAGSRRSLEPQRPQHIAVDMNGSDSAQGDVSRIEPLMQHKRITVEIRNLSAYVPSLFGQPSLLQRMNPRTIRKVKAAGGSLRRPKINQVG